jgi:hypothetical protein
MFSKSFIAASVVAMAVAAANAAALNCPTHEGDKVLDLLDQAPTCEKSLALFEACGFGSSADVALGEVVIRKCEGDFLAKLSKSQRQAYDREQMRCSRKYRNESGTMYRSFEAFCRANLAKDYVTRIHKGSKS